MNQCDLCPLRKRVIMYTDNDWISVDYWLMCPACECKERMDFANTRWLKKSRQNG